MEEAKKRGVTFGFSGRIVVHHQICPGAVASLKEAVAVVLKKKAGGESQEMMDVRTTYGGL